MLLEEAYIPVAKKRDMPSLYTGLLESATKIGLGVYKI